MGALTPAQALLSSGLIAAGSSLTSGLLSSSSAAKNNRTALDFQKWSQIQAQQWQEQMYSQQKMDQENFYKKYQSPEAIAAQLSKLGVNPAQVLTGGSGVGAAPASMPSGMSSPALSAPALENEGTAFASSIQSIGSALSSFAQAGYQNEQSEEMVHTLNTRMNQLLLQEGNQRLLNAKAKWDLFCEQVKLPYELQNMALDAYSKFVQGKYSESLTVLNEVAYYIQDKTKDLSIEEKQKAVSLLGEQILVAQGQQGLLKEQAATERERQKTERTQQGLNNASAFNQRAQGNMVKSQKVMQDFYNRIYNNKEMANALYYSIIQAAKHAGNQNRIDSETVKLIEQKVEAARKANNYYELQFWLGQAHELLRDGAVIAGEINRSSMLGRFMSQGSTSGFSPTAGQGYTIDQNGGLSRVYDAQGKPLIFR